MGTILFIGKEEFNNHSKKCLKKAKRIDVMQKTLHGCKFVMW